jgi:hypothetical protein
MPSAISDLKEKISAGNPKTIQESMDALMKLSEELYKQQAPGAGGAGPGSAGPGGMGGQQFYGGASGTGEAGPTPGPESGTNDAKGKGKDGAVDADYEVVD